MGGTSIKAGLVEDSGRVLFEASVATPPRHASTDEVVAAIIAAGSAGRAAAERMGRTVEGVGFGLPEYSIGPEWIQTKCDHIPALEGVALYPPLRRAFGDSIAIDLDTHAATLAELRFGAGAGYERLILMVVGTGISCGIVVDGDLLRHTLNTSGDTGHVIVEPEGVTACACGGHGCLDAVASARAIARAGLAAAQSGASAVLASRYAERGVVDAHDVTDAARLGDPAASQILARTGRLLGVGLTSMMHIYLPQVILLGGGASGAGELLLSPVRRAIDDLAAPYCREQLREVRVAALGAEAGIVGTATLVLFGARIPARARSARAVERAQEPSALI